MKYNRGCKEQKPLSFHVHLTAQWGSKLLVKECLTNTICIHHRDILRYVLT